MLNMMKAITAPLEIPTTSNCNPSQLPNKDA
jgi:hypothetical protein